MQVAKRVAVLLYDRSGDQNQDQKEDQKINQHGNKSPVVIPACYGLIYPGVAEGFHAKKLGDCGFFASFSPSILAPGQYRVCLAVESTDGRHLQVSRPLAGVEVK